MLPYHHPAASFRLLGTEAAEARLLEELGVPVPGGRGPGVLHWPGWTRRTSDSRHNSTRQQHIRRKSAYPGCAHCCSTSNRALIGQKAYLRVGATPALHRA